MALLALLCEFSPEAAAEGQVSPAQVHLLADVVAGRSHFEALPGAPHS